MRYSSAVLAIAGLAAAQSSTISSYSITSTAATPSSTAESGCGSAVDAIIQNCLGTYMLQVNACAGDDYSCQCAGWTQVNQCYNNCPSDPNAFGAQQNRQQFCAAASAYGSSTSTHGNATVAATSGHSGATTTGNSAASASSASANGSPIATGNNGDATGAASAATNSEGGAAPMATPAALGLAAMFGLAALL